MTEYPQGEHPDHWLPNPAEATHRFILGRAPQSGGKPLVVVAMNPSHASDLKSDRTVNRVVDASIGLGYDGWTMLNVYPERSSTPKALGAFDPRLSSENAQAIVDYLRASQTTEVWGAWGDLSHRNLVLGQVDVICALKTLGVGVFTFGSLTVNGQPRHPSPPGNALDWRLPKSYWLESA
ncbi:MAG: DUF1643 domain-containing protein [Actinomycetota bacterium]|nr:DUF1643 domain-containing protein [Actinomycetota bacterium]